MSFHPSLFKMVGLHYMPFFASRHCKDDTSCTAGLKMCRIQFSRDELRLGWHAVKTSRTTLDFLGGINYTNEDYSSLQRNLVAITAGEELVRKFGAASVITEKLYVYPNLNQTGDYRAAFNLGTVTKLSKWLGWQNAFGDIYVTNPPTGKQKNDLQLTTGLNVAFTH